MSRVHSLRFEFLEARTLLSKAHLAMPHAAPAVTAAPLVLDGTLTIDNHAASPTMNEDGSTTTSTPVVGRLGSLGVVRGVWNESVDEYGDYIGPDTLRLHASKGAFVVAFNNASSGPAHPAAHGAVYYEHPQRVYYPIGTYAGDSESGSIELITNPARTSVVSMKLSTQNT
jgi:hypothetical protein